MFTEKLTKSTYFTYWFMSQNLNHGICWKVSLSLNLASSISPIHLAGEGKLLSSLYHHCISSYGVYSAPLYNKVPSLRVASAFHLQPVFSLGQQQMQD